MHLKSLSDNEPLMFKLKIKEFSRKNILAYLKHVEKEYENRSVEDLFAQGILAQARFTMVVVERLGTCT